MSTNTVLRYGYHTAGLAICGAILSAFYTFAYRPLQQHQDDVVQQRDTISQLAGKREIVVARNNRLAVQEQKLATEVAAFSEQIAKGSREDEMLREISRTAQSSETQLVDFQPSGSGQFNEMPTSIVRLTLRGKYTSVCRFLSGLQESGRLHRITQLSVQAANRANADYDLRLELQWYQQPATSPRRS